MSTAIQVRDATKTDIPQIVRVHREAFPGFLMTLLGPAFLRRYYETVLDYEKRVFVVTTDEQGQFRGFAAGFLCPADFYKLLGTRKRKMMIAGALHVVIRPGVWSRVIENMGQVGQRAQDDSHAAPFAVELASIGVSSAVGGKGWGKALVKGFIQRASELGGQVVELTTDAEGNERVNAFYQGLGFCLVTTSSRAGGRKMNHYECSTAS